MNADEVLSFGQFHLIPSKRLLYRGQQSVDVGSRALDVLIALVESAGEVVGQRELMRRAWPDVVVGDGSLRVAIRGLRKALGDGQDGSQYIANVAGRGYSFLAPVDRSNMQSPTRRASSKPALPRPLARMVGRADAIETLSNLTIAQRFVTVVGPGGMGKTTVAISVAHALLHYFDQAVFFVDLSVLSDENHVTSTVAAALGLSEQTQDPLPALVAFLAERRLLLILDNCEHVIGAAAALAESLYRESPRVHILATSRESLRVEGEQVYLLTPLQFPNATEDLTADKALATPAVQLFMQRAAASGHTEKLSDADAHSVAAICSRLDGIALAIELAGSQVGAFGIQGTANLLNNRFKLLWQGRRTAPPRQQTMTALLDWSFNLLSERHQRVLARLSIFVGPFTLEAAQTIAADNQISAIEVADAITGLILNSLLLIIPIDGAANYRLLDPTRAYANEKLAQTTDLKATARQHALYFAQHLSRRAGIGLAIRPEDVRFASPYLGNLRAALECSFSETGELPTGVMLAAATAPLFYDLALYVECSRWCQRGLAALPASDLGSATHLTLQAFLAASMMLTQGNSDEVRNGIEAALQLADTRGDQEYQSHLLVGLGIFRARTGDFQGALTLARRTIAITQTIGTPGAIAAGGSVLGVAHHFIGDQIEARLHCERGLARAQAADTAMVAFFGYDHEIRALMALARCYWLIGLPDRAADTARQVIDLATQRDHPFNLCMTLIFTTTVFLWRGDLAEAQQLIERLTTHALRHSLCPFQAVGMALNGELSLARGDHAEGAKLLRRALEVLRTAKQRALMPAFHAALAAALLKMGNTAEAAAEADTGLRLSETFEESLNTPELLRIRGEIWLQTTPANPTAAERAFQMSLNKAKQQSTLSLELRSAMSLSHLWASQGKTTAAAELLLTTYRKFSEGLQTHDLKLARELLAQLTPCARHRRLSHIS